MAAEPSLDYFESEQVKLAVMLWKARRKNRGTDFDVLRFGRDWPYAETVIVESLAAVENTESDLALQLMQLRLRLENQQPERAVKLGAFRSAPTDFPTEKNATPAMPKNDKTGKPDNPDPTDPNIDKKYLKGLR